jgi:uncharacterized protein YcfJ
MNKLITVGALIGVAAASAGVAGYRMASEPAYAEVVRVTPLIAAIETPNGNPYSDITEYTWGYNVRYRIGNEIGNVRMDYDPGDRIPLRDGQLRTQM